MVGPLRFERRTSRLSAVRSTRLSYGPEMKGKCDCLKLESSRKEIIKLYGWWARCDSNAGPHGYQPCAPPG